MLFNTLTVFFILLIFLIHLNLKMFLYYILTIIYELLFIKQFLFRGVIVSYSFINNNKLIR